MTTDEVRVLKTVTCPSLSGRTKLTYEVGGGPGSQIYIRITKTAGTGSFSKDWVALERIHALLEKNSGKPITSHTLAPLFTSANNPGFTLAVMKHERLVRPIADNPRCYERLDGKAFFSEIEALMGSKPAAPKKVAQAKTATIRPPAPSVSTAVPSSPTPAVSPTALEAKKPEEAPRAKPAVYISEVHGPLVPAPRKAAKRSAKR
jgi:hypothetical protein